MLRKKHEGPASLFCRKAEVLFGALKTKSCLSVSEFFLFSGNTCRSSPKSADGEFFSDKSSTTRLCFVSFVRAKEMKIPCRIAEKNSLSFTNYFFALQKNPHLQDVGFLSCTHAHDIIIFVVQTLSLDFPLPIPGDQAPRYRMENRMDGVLLPYRSTFQNLHLPYMPQSSRYCKNCL